MGVIILLYILLCYKASLGVEWYDWTLLGLVVVATFVNQAGKEFMARGGEVPSLKKEKGSFFNDLLPGEKKNGKDSKKS